jgi:lysophospholipase L1-like esterase
MMKKTDRIVCLGDSLTWGFPYGPLYSWVHLVGEQYRLNLINHGINGNLTEDMLARFERDVVSAKPSHVIIMGGTNDVIIRESFPRITLNLEQIVEQAFKWEIQPILGLPIPLGWSEPEVRLARVRDWIQNFAAQKNLPVINFAQGFYRLMTQGEYELRWDLLLDGSHPTIEGYEAMAEQFDPAALGLAAKNPEPELG